MYRNFFKRVVDIVLSLILIIILLPVFLIVSILVISSLGFPIFFKQVRVGKDRKPFTIYKFKILKNGYTSRSSESMPKITKFFDDYKFNELPQFFNVLKGDMSLVGPRPFICGEKLPSDPSNDRYSLRPGMTGLAQINGGRKISHDKKLEYDLKYNKELSFFLDMKILFMTPFRILRDR